MNIPEYPVPEANTLNAETCVGSGPHDPIDSNF